MQVNGLGYGLGVQQNQSFFARPAAQGNNMAAAGLSQGAPRRDTLSLGGSAGRAFQAIDRLNEQKQGLIEQKGALIQRTLDNGVGIDKIEDALAYYDEQILGIEEQIDGVLARQTQLQMENLARTKQNEDASDEEDPEKDRINQLSKLSAKVNRAGAYTGASATTQRQANAEVARLENDDRYLEFRKLFIKGNHNGGSRAERTFLRQARQDIASKIQDVVQTTGEKLNSLAFSGGQALQEINRETTYKPPENTTAPEKENEAENGKAGEATLASGSAASTDAAPQSGAQAQHGSAPGASPAARYAAQSHYSGPVAGPAAYTDENYIPMYVIA